MPWNGTEATAASTPPFSRALLDHAFFPDIIDDVFNYASYGSLLVMRAVCKAWRERVNSKILATVSLLECAEGCNQTRHCHPYTSNNSLSPLMVSRSTQSVRTLSLQTDCRLPRWVYCLRNLTCIRTSAPVLGTFPGTQAVVRPSPGYCFLPPPLEPRCSKEEAEKRPMWLPPFPRADILGLGPFATLNSERSVDAVFAYGVGADRSPNLAVSALPRSVTLLLLPLPEEVAMRDPHSSYHNWTWDVVGYAVAKLIALGRKVGGMSLTVVGLDVWCAHSFEMRYYATPPQRVSLSLHEVRPWLASELWAEDISPDEAEELIANTRFLTLDDYRAEVGEERFQFDSELVYSGTDDAYWELLKAPLQVI